VSAACAWPVRPACVEGSAVNVESVCTRVPVGMDRRLPETPRRGPSNGGPFVLRPSLACMWRALVRARMFVDPRTTGYFGTTERQEGRTNVSANGAAER